MIVIAATVLVKPEAREDARRAAIAMGAASRAEAGCIEYRFWGCLEDPNRFFLFERWESAEALARHGQTEHMRAFREQLPGFVAAPFTIDRWVVSPAT